MEQVRRIEPIEMMIKMSKKKSYKTQKDNDYIDINYLFNTTLFDIDINVELKKLFGICPIECIYLILKYPNSKL